MAETKRRGRKTTHHQMEVIVNFIKSNKIFTTGKCHPTQPNELEDKWEELKEKLNSEPGGAIKTAKQWRTFVSEWKSRVRKKARSFRENLTRTGGGGYIHRDLSELENKLMAAIGWLVITGNEELPPEIDPEECINDAVNILKADDDIIVAGDEDIVAGDEAAAQFESEELAAAEQQETHLPQSVPVRDNRQQKRPKRSRCYTTNKSQLQKSAELYSKSASELNAAITKLSESMNTLASAINNFAEAIKKPSNC